MILIFVILYLTLSPCDQKPCRNGGTCVPVYENDSHACQCPPIAEGKHCEEVQWTAFWWYDANTTWPYWGDDVLKYDFGHCNSTDPYCFGRLPWSAVEDSTEMLAVDSENTTTSGVSTPAMMLLMQSGAHSMITSSPIIRTCSIGKNGHQMCWVVIHQLKLKIHSCTVSNMASDRSCLMTTTAIIAIRLWVLAMACALIMIMWIKAWIHFMTRTVLSHELVLDWLCTFVPSTRTKLLSPHFRGNCQNFQDCIRHKLISGRCQ